MTSADDYRFDLPGELIAQDPAERRGDSRLLQVEPGCGVVGERVFRELPDLLRPGDLLVLNESRVLPARLGTRRADTGGRVEILLVEPHNDTGEWRAMARPARRLKPGVRLLLDDEGREHLEVRDRRDDGMVVVGGSDAPEELARRRGAVPLPPYIRRSAQTDDAGRAARDRERYQTVYARTDREGAGSVAAPTAGLHFSGSTLQRLRERGVDLAQLTLHVGPGTFQPPSDEQLARGRLHAERFTLPAQTTRKIAETRRRGGRVIAVGTTSLRVLETAARLDLPGGGPATALEFAADPSDPEPVFAGRAERRDDSWLVEGVTRLFVRPPARLASVDGLLTNFHLPGSSLLMLVAALIGPQQWRPVYEHAVGSGLRFYSYGDCMLILPGQKED